MVKTNFPPDPELVGYKNGKYFITFSDGSTKKFNSVWARQRHLHKAVKERDKAINKVAVELT